MSNSNSNPFLSILKSTTASSSAGKENKKKSPPNIKATASKAAPQTSTLTFVKAATTQQKTSKPTTASSGSSASSSSTSTKPATAVKATVQATSTKRPITSAPPASSANSKRLQDVKALLSKLETLTDGKLQQSDLFNKFVNANAAAESALSVNHFPKDVVTTGEAAEDEGEVEETDLFELSILSPLVNANSSSSRQNQQKKSSKKGARYSFGVSRFSLPGRLSIDTRRISMGEFRTLSALSPSVDITTDRKVQRQEEQSTCMNFLEFCAVGVDRAILSGFDTPRQSTLQPPQILDLFPIRDASMPSPIIESIADYCYPYGVPLRLVPEDEVKAMMASPPRDAFHILQFMDAAGKPTYACCLTVTEVLDAPNAVIVENLQELHLQETAADTIKRFLRDVVSKSLRGERRSGATATGTATALATPARTAYTTSMMTSLSTWSTRFTPSAAPATSAKTPMTSIFSRLSSYAESSLTGVKPEDALAEGEDVTSPSSASKGLMYNPLGLSEFFSDDNSAGSDDGSDDENSEGEGGEAKREQKDEEKDVIEDQFLRPHRPYRTGRSASSASAAAEAPVSSSGNAPRTLLTQRTYCLISTKPLHTVLFKTLEAIAHKERAGRHSSGSTFPSSSLASAVQMLSRHAEGRFRSASAQSIAAAGRMLSRTARSCSSSAAALGQTDADVGAVAWRTRSESTASNASNISVPNATGAIMSDAYFLSRKTRRDKFLAQVQRLALDSDSNLAGVTEISCPSYIKCLRFESRTTTLEEWTTAALFCTLPPQVIVQVVSMLLLEKSLIICGSDIGLVTTIGTAFTQLLRPFLWEGVFVPILPISALEVLEAPVPFIVGTSATLPSLHEVSNTAAVLFIDDYLEQTSASRASSAYRKTHRRRFLLVPTGEDAAYLTDPTKNAHLAALCQEITRLSSQLKLGLGNKPLSLRAAATQLVTFMLGMTHAEKKIVQELLEVVERHNRQLCGDVLEAGGWRKYGSCGDSGQFEFYPELFVEPLRARLQFQEGLVHTQLFVSFLDKISKAKE